MSDLRPSRIESEATNGPALPKQPGPGNGGTSSDAPETLLAPRFTFREWREMLRAMRDKSYQQTPLGPDVVEYLAWKRLSRAAERTLDQYERDLRLVCFATSTGVENVTHGDLMLVLEVVPEKVVEARQSGLGRLLQVVGARGPSARQSRRATPEAPPHSRARLRPVEAGGARPAGRGDTQDGEPAP